MTTKSSRLGMFAIILIGTLFLGKCDAGTYEQKQQLFFDLLNSSVYNPQIRPVKDQNHPVYVGATFQLVSIVGIDDVGEQFHCNGFLAFFWQDERLRWNPADYGNETVFRPRIKDVWKPRTLLLNTLTERDLFEDNPSPFYVDSDGSVLWAPGSVFSTSCELDMSNYPYDIQTCYLELLANGYVASEVTLFGTGEPVLQNFFTPNGEWELTHSNVSTKLYHLDETYMSGIQVSFTLQRRPTFLLLNVVIPVVILSFLNILVFLIPVNSGEKLSYGITVLLAVSVFLSIVSGMLPRSSKIVPNVTVYLACLLIMSVLTVVDCIIIVFLHNLEENEDASLKATENFKRTVNKVKILNKAVAPSSTLPRFSTSGHNSKSTSHFGEMREATPGLANVESFSLKHNLNEENGRMDSSGTLESKIPKRNKYRLVGKYIDLVSFIVFFLIWLGLTVGFMAKISSNSK